MLRREGWYLPRMGSYDRDAIGIARRWLATRRRSRCVPRLLSALALVSLFACVLAACGRSGGQSDEVSRRGRGPSASGGRLASSGRLVVDKDRDYDGSPQTRYDADDYKILSYGRAASATTARQIVARLRRYYAAAALHDGRKACALMSAGAAQATIEIYGAGREPYAPRQRTCAAVATRLFEHFQRRMALDSATLAVRGIRLGPALGYALLSFRGQPDRHMLLYREAGAWKVDAALDDVLV